jgi:hypothetical protein
MGKKKIGHEFTACESTENGDVIVYTDEGDETPIVVPRHRLGALVCTVLDALDGKRATR